MSFLSTLLRRLRSFWLALFRRSGAPADPPSLPPAAPPPPAAEPALATLVPEEPVSSSMLQSAGPETSLAGASIAASPAEPPPPLPRGPAVLPTIPFEGSVRQFFARVAAAAPGGLVVDFTAWQTAKVERFFLALGSPERTQRRGPALAEDAALGSAFDGFQWD